MFNVLVGDQSTNLLKGIANYFLHVGHSIPDALGEHGDDIRHEATGLNRSIDNKLVRDNQSTGLNLPF